MDEVILSKLYETFELKSRQGTGGMVFKYVPNEDVINRMNQTFHGNWSTSVGFKDVIDDQVVMEVVVSVVDPETGKHFEHTGYGSSQIQRYKDGPNAGKIIDLGNAYKGALAKGIVNACTRWGVGLFKEHNAMEDDGNSVSNYSAPSPNPAPQNVAAPPKPSAPAQPTNNFTPPPVPNIPNQAANPAPAPKPAPVVAAPVASPQAAAPPTSPSPAPPVAQSPGLPPGVPSSVSNSMTLAQTAEPKPAAQPMPSFPAPDMNPPATPDVPFSKQEGGGNGITDVQRVALNGILSMMKGVSYDDLAKEAFEANGIDKDVPVKENLTYEDAVIVIKYGNDKYRKR